MIVSYPAVFYKYAEGHYNVIFPDFDVATCGINLEDATRMAIDCLAGEIKWYKKKGEEIPEPTLDLDLIVIDEKDEENNYIEVTKQIITVDADEYAKKYFDKTVKKIIYISEGMNEEVSELNIDISLVLHDALLDEIHRRKYEDYENYNDNEK